MNKKPTKEEVFEMIELAADDIEVLARAFEIIDAACRGKSLEEESELIARPSPSPLLN